MNDIIAAYGLQDRVDAKIKEFTDNVAFQDLMFRNVLIETPFKKIDPSFDQRAVIFVFTRTPIIQARANIRNSWHEAWKESFQVVKPSILFDTEKRIPEIVVDKSIPKSVYVSEIGSWLDSMHFENDRRTMLVSGIQSRFVWYKGQEEVCCYHELRATKKKFSLVQMHRGQDTAIHRTYDLENMIDHLLERKLIM